MSRPTINPNDAKVNIDGEWVTIPEGLRRLREASSEMQQSADYLRRVKDKPRKVSMWDKVIATFLVLMVPLIFSSFMQDIWTSNDLEVSTKILLTFTVGFTSVLWIVARMMWWGEKG